MPEPGRIYWSVRANRFYQEGRRGIVSNDQGVNSLRFDPERNRYIDQRGRTAPLSVFDAPRRTSRKDIAYDSTNKPFLKTERVFDGWDQNKAQHNRVGSNQSIVVKATVVTGDGKVHTVHMELKQGQNYDPASHRLLLEKKARARLVDKGYKLNTGQVANRITGVTFQRRTLNVIRL